MIHKTNRILTLLIISNSKKYRQGFWFCVHKHTLKNGFIYIAFYEKMKLFLRLQLSLYICRRSHSRQAMKSNNLERFYWC